MPTLPGATGIRARWPSTSASEGRRAASMETIWTIEILGMNMLQFTFYVGMVLAVVLIALILVKRR